MIEQYLPTGMLATAVLIAGVSSAHANCNAAMNEYDAELQDNVHSRMQLAGPLQQDLRRSRDAASFERGDSGWLGDESAREQIDSYFAEG